MSQVPNSSSEPASSAQAQPAIPSARLSQREVDKRASLRSPSGAQDSAADRALWFDARAVPSDDPRLSLIERRGYTGILVSVAQSAEFAKRFPRLTIVVAVATARDGEEFVKAARDVQGSQSSIHFVIASGDHKVLTGLQRHAFPTCYSAFVDSNESLHAAIAHGKAHDYLLIRFRDPTNIPLELVIASLQRSQTVLINQIEGEDVEAALVALGVMEVGADGVMFSPRVNGIEQLAAAIASRQQPAIAIEEVKVTSARPVGMGFRACVDLATLFTEQEGMVIGSTSQGGILCCPEVFHLPYMELRPFRVNAGAIHSYVFGSGSAEQTAYLSELRAGEPVSVIGLDGMTRSATVGRIKTELRPLRLIEAEFATGEPINIILQDDWHVRVYSADGKPKNITEIKPDDRLLASPFTPGRHVGISVDEQIFET